MSAEHNVALNALDFITGKARIEIDYAEGAKETVDLHDGSAIRLHKLAADHDWRDRSAALAMLERHRVAGEVVTGLIYLNDEAIDMHERLGTTKRPLNSLGEAETLSGLKALAAINASLR